MNSKELHIRVWDSVENNMITDEQKDGVPILVITNKGILRLSPMHKENLWELIPFGNRFIPMIGSGIPDAEGSEIYEHMWVRQECTLTGDEYAPGHTVFTGEVKHYEGTWVIDNGVDAIPLWSEHRVNTIVRDYQYAAVAVPTAKFSEISPRIAQLVAEDIKSLTAPGSVGDYRHKFSDN